MSNMLRVLALVKTELKKIIREPAFLFMMLLFPAALTLIFGLTFGTMESGIYGLSQFDIMAPGLFAYSCIFIIMIVAQTFTDYREQGLLKRINLTPLTSVEFMSSHIISNTILSIVQVVIVAVCSLLIGFRPHGSVIGFLLAFIFMITLSICSVGFGLICSTVAKNAGTATALSFIFILPQMFFGTFIPLNEATKVIAYFLPSYYATESLSMIFLDGVALTNLTIWMNLGILSILAIVIVFMGILLFKRYGKG
ncbi:MAG: ABC transporter permease [Promethearchaeota archaeon]|nr:MAG: ABC transporter permease [Candidatus Lokiarchaeota archaeon]